MRPEHPYIDYTLLDPKAPLSDYAQLAVTARGRADVVRSVCVPPSPEIVRVCQGELAGSSLGVCTVIDFPFGHGGGEKKLAEMIPMLDLGVSEFDVVINLSALRRGDIHVVSREIRALQMATEVVRLKAILETGHEWYNETLIKLVSHILHDAGVWCLKTSTGRHDIETSAGFLPSIDLGTKLQHAVWMHEACPDLMIKLAGGIQHLQDVRDICALLPKDKVLVGASNPIWLYSMID